ncbi:triose-phosphate transporter family-domain-containing protein [Fomitopsis serialis]|uniref:triose-phosphate transporter family-domain-containing protein n=1 Tax=Fomitopsis serialis TaxID=139415 RepID=UPI002008A121|nr:triose-phosphate transporter family-domain-containing protein [Neoantrodia serialis]KAH9913757.1 triose-phosphate transporter family-domain-containing protein [Neoantrodia serialis]
MRPARLSSNHFDVPAHRPQSPRIGSFFCSPDLSSSRWQSLRSQVRDRAPAFGSALHDDGPTSVVFQPLDALPSSSDKPYGSPRHRPGFSHSTSLGSSIPPSPILTDVGSAPALPVLSPYATESSKRLTLRRTKRSQFFTLPQFVETQAFWLVLYFTFNLGLTLYNKLVLVHFPFPYTLTALHALCGTLGGLTLRRRGTYVPAKLSARSSAALAAFGVLYAVNIAVSNVSLQMVTIPFHQVVRAATPIFTTALSMLLFGTQFTRLKILSLIPVMAGVALATYGDYYFTFLGLLLTLLGTFLAALKTIYTNVLQSSPSSSRPHSARLPVPPRLALHPLDLLTRTSPLACALCLFYACVSGELGQARTSLVPHTMAGCGRVLVILGNGVIAFGLNVVSLSANKKVGALNMTVAANVKQALTILCAVGIFHLTITPANALGICVTLAGGAWYAWVEYSVKHRSSA